VTVRTAAEDIDPVRDEIGKPFNDFVGDANRIPFP
jgi:hypothetical protein